MSDETITKEQKQVNAIIKRWFRYHGVWTTVYTAIMLAAYFFMFKVGHQFDQGRDLILITLHLVGLSGISYMLKVNFARQLSSVERNLLFDAQSSALGRSEAQLIGQLLRECNRNPHIELLRASDEPHNSDTLLRAAASTETTQQNQLLRPTQDADQ